MRELLRFVPGDFDLDASKLQRMVSIVGAAFAGTTHDLHLGAIVKNRKRIAAKTLDELLAVDNTIANPIIYVEVQATSEIEGKTCEIAFRTETDGFLSGIDLAVKSNEMSWAGNLFSELEEQVDRTIRRDLISKYRQSHGLRRFMPIIMALIFSATFLFTILKSVNYIPGDAAALKNLAAHGQSAQTIDEKLDFLVDYTNLQIARIEAQRNLGWSLGSLDQITIPLLLGAAPFLLMAGLAAFAVTTCYPGSVFVWGDIAEHYLTLVRRRAQIWNIVVVVFLVGLLINLSSAVLVRGIGIQ